MSVLEILALMCFGASWPFAIMKTYSSKTSRGKSFVFLTLLLVGYVCAVANKLVNAPGDAVVYLWAVNGIMVATDLSLSLYYRSFRDVATTA